MPIKLPAVLIFMLIFSMTGVVQAEYVDVTVKARSAPWVFSSTLNTGYSFGGVSEGQNNSNLPPTVVSSPLAMTPGDTVTITWRSGVVCGGGGSGNWCGVGYYDAGGNTSYGSPYHSPSGALGSPAAYIPAAQFPDPSYFMELMGVFADSTGQIVGSPFMIGNAATVIIPSGASQLQMGFIDGWYNDNLDNGGDLLTVRVAETAATAPEPSAMLLLGLGLMGLAGVRKSSGN